MWTIQSLAESLTESLAESLTESLTERKNYVVELSLLLLAWKEAAKKDPDASD